MPKYATKLVSTSCFSFILSDICLYTYSFSWCCQLNDIICFFRSWKHKCDMWFLREQLYIARLTEGPNKEGYIHIYIYIYIHTHTGCLKIDATH